MLKRLYLLLYSLHDFIFNKVYKWFPEEAIQKCFERCSTLKSWVPTEAATRGVLWKKVFLKILQNSQENTCARVSFLIKLHTPGLQLYWKETLVQVFCCEFCEISRNTLFAEHLWTTASVTTKYNRIIIRNFHITAANMVWTITKTVEI